MTSTEKLASLKSFLNISDVTQDSALTAYLDFAKLEILSWLYSGNTPEGVTDVPTRYEPTQIMACVVAYNLEGVESQLTSVENSITRQFKYATMVDYIRSNVIPYVGVI